MWRTGLADFPAVKKGEIQELQKILDEEIPRLWRLASPSHYSPESIDYDDERHPLLSDPQNYAAIESSLTWVRIYYFSFFPVC